MAYFSRNFKKNSFSSPKLIDTFWDQLEFIRMFFETISNFPKINPHLKSGKLKKKSRFFKAEKI
jgi:hypothetical protein